MAVNTTVSIADADLQEELVSALVEQGHKRGDALAVVRATFLTGDSFEDAFRRALNHLASHRAAGSPIRLASTRSIKSISSTESSRFSTPSPAAPPLPEHITRAPAAGARPEPTAKSPEAQRQAPKAPKKPEKHVPTKKLKGRPLCACGCKQPTRSNVSPYIRGHNPATKSAANAAATPRRAKASKNQTRSLIVRAANGAPVWDDNRATNITAVSGRVSELQLDRIWTSMSVQEKAALLFGENS